MPVKLTSNLIKQKAAEYGATVCGIGDIRSFSGAQPENDPKHILPNAACVIGFGFHVPSGLYKAMESGVQSYSYTSLGVKYIDEEFAQIFLLRMSSLIENAGYDACLQRTAPNLKVKGDKTANPEAVDVHELWHTVSVGYGKPAPEVILDFNKAAVICGLGSIGLYGKVLSPKYGPFMRYNFIITDAPLKPDEVFDGNLCDNCGKCAEACPGHAISADHLSKPEGLDSWQCAVYYRGAHKSNPFMTDDFLKDDPDRDKVLNGEKRFDSTSAREIFKQMDFLPRTQYGYVPCLCGKKCDVACFRHLKEVGSI